MEGLQQSVDELKTLIEKMNTTVTALAPLVPSVATLVAMASLEKSKNKEDDGQLGPLPYRPPLPPPPVTQPPVHPRYSDHLPETQEDDHSFLRPRMVFPSFDGASDPLPWINCCELYFHSHNTPDHKKVWMASLHMTDAAQLWYYRFEMIQGEPDWRRFCQLVNRHFGPAITESPLGELTQLRRMGMVEEYAKQFISLACREVELSECQQVQIFIAGLTNPLRTDVAIQSPVS